MNTSIRPITLGVIVGNRGFFPDHLCLAGHKQIMDVLDELGINAVIIDENATSNGAVESLQEARQCADLFKSRRDDIDGILVTLPNFGDERAIANVLRFASLDVPVLVHAFKDETMKMSIANRRDSFCGKMSACNNLRQYGIKFSLTREHTMDPKSEEFKEDLTRFASVCRVVGSIKGARFGQIGARPAAFNTVRFSEKLLERSGISVETLDLSELLGWIRKMTDSDAPVKSKLQEIQAYTDTSRVPVDKLMLQAKLAVAIDRFVTDNELDATAIQCWTAMQEFYGVVPCTCMSMLSNDLKASACEADIAGVLSMFALQQAAVKPAALLDWNNNFGDDPNKGVVFHCSNLPKAFFADHEMDYQEIIAGSLGKENTYGTMVGRIASGPFTFARVTTDDLEGRIKAYVGAGQFTDDTMQTFGGYGVFQVENLQKLLRHICEQGYEHHVAATRAQVAPVLKEAFSNYLDWEVYEHV